MGVDVTSSTILRLLRTLRRPADKDVQLVHRGHSGCLACGGSLYLSVVAAADAANAKVIGVDVDQSYVSDKIITSAMNQLKTSTMLALKALNDNGGTWPAEYAGVTAVLGAAEDCVCLPTDADSWRFTKFTVDEYTALFNSLFPAR
jgi:basic membrane protein A